MKRPTKRYLPLFLALLLCAGCGKAPGSSGGSDGGQNLGAVTSEDGSGRTYRVEQTISLEIEDPEEAFTNKSIYSGSYGSILYLLASYQLESDEAPVMWLYTFDLNTLETEKVPFLLETPGMEKPYVESMAVTGQDELTFRVHGTLEGKASSGYLYKTDLSGKPLDGETPFLEDKGYPPVTGRFVAAPDGAAFVAETGESMTTSISRYDAQSQTLASLATVNDFVKAFCSDGQAGLYYVNSTRLMHLDLNDMTEEILCNAAEYGVKMAYENWLLTDNEGKLAFCAVNDSATVVYLFTDREEDPDQAAAAERETIRMTCPYGYDYLIYLAYNWTAASDDYGIIVEEIPLEQLQAAKTSAETSKLLEPLRTRMMAELVAGKGPELMLVSEDDMHILAEKGALMDLSELIPEEIQEQLLPAFRSIGTVDGTWVGMTENVWYYTLMTPDALWSEDSWTVSDILDLAESRDDWDWIMSEPWFDEGTDYNALFERLFAVSMGDSPFMDVENGISYFNGEEFIRTLELCKRYGQSGDVAAGNDDAIRTMVQDGKGIARRLYLLGGLFDFSKAMAGYEKCHIVGYPSEKGNGNYMYSPCYLVVNAKTENLDAVKDYIAYILDYNIQFGVGSNGVRKDVLRDQITVHPDYNVPAVLVNPLDLDSGYSYAPIPDLKPDGTTYIEEYMEFVENCEPMPYCPDAISEIIQEEIGDFFVGSRSAKDTADIIHRRVQLYFDERN